MIASLSCSCGIPLKYANRHGLITGATGTGKTVTLQKLAESFSFQGVPVFVADVKGDIAALARSCPTQFLDVFGRSGKPLQVTVSAFGSDLMARMFELSDTQAGCLEIAFAIADSDSFHMRTLADLRDVLRYMVENRQAVSMQYGQVTAASVGVIQRSILRLERQGADRFFNAPQFDVADFLDSGLVSILQAEKLILSPRVYSAFLLWMLSELWERLPEIGDCEKPLLVMFFDEAHLIFNDCPPALLRKIEQTVRLIRSKGVGVYFVSQSPSDIPAIIREQLAHVVAHERALRVGQARFASMGVVRGVVQIEMPACPLGALNESELLEHAPAVPEAAKIAAPFPHGRLIALCGLAAVGAVCWFIGGAWQWGSIAAAVVFAGAFKR